MSSGPVTLRIERLGAQGDGVAEHDGRTVFVPFTLPGERVRAEIEGDRARLLEVLDPSPERAAAKCPHFGECGGCSLQHLSAETYAALKLAQLRTALSYAGVQASIDPMIPIAPATRRRAVLAAHRKDGKAVVGFHGRRSHRIVRIVDCAVATPGIVGLLPKLEILAAIAAPPRDALQITVTETDTGFDVSLFGVARGLSADARARLVEAAAGAGIVRLSINGEPVMEQAAPTLAIGDVRLVPPPGGFLQACRGAEDAMANLVAEAVRGSRHVVDLFSGSGAFALRLAATAAVHAVESEAAAMSALGRAAKRAAGLKPVTTEQRDLFRRPLTRAELRRFDAAVIDPPRAGAEAQTRELAASSLTRLAMVSCNAQTFARDLAIMVGAGWTVSRITPIDQFLWSPHVEIVAQLSR